MRRTEATAPADLAEPVILVLGDRALLVSLGPVPPKIPGMVFAAIADVDAALLQRVLPDVVLSPLMAGAHDAIDIARTLADAGFRGRYRVICAGLPQPAAVKSELQQAAPGMDIDILRYPLDLD